MASANVSNHAAAPVAAEKTHLKQQTNAEEPAVAPETTRFPKVSFQLKPTKLKLN